MPRKSNKTADEVTADEVNAEPKVKHPIPDGFDKPSDFALYVEHHKLWNGTAAQIFNFTKGAFAAEKTDKDGNKILNEDGSVAMTEPNGFPAVIHTDGRKIIKREDAIAWLNEYSTRRAAAKQVAAERAAERIQAVVLSVGRYTLAAFKLVNARKSVSELATIAD